MANEVLIKVGADITDFSRKMADAQKSLKGFSSANKDTFDSFKQVGAVVTGAGVAIAAGLGASVMVASDFQSAFAGVRKTVDTSEAGFAILEKGIREMAKVLPATASEIAAVAESAGQLGIEEGNILSFTRTMIDLGEATNLTAEEAANSFARFANITKMPQSEFDKLGSVVVELGNNMATTESEIVAMSMRLAAQGKQVGMTESDIMALSGTMSSLGIDAEAGGSAMTMVLTKMQKAVGSGGKELTKFAKAAGMSSKEFAESFKNDPVKALEQLSAGLGDSADAGGNMSAILEDLGISGIREADVMKRLAGNSELLGQAVETANGAWDENTALTEEAAQRYETFESKLAILGNKFADIGITIGNVMLPAMEKLVKIVGKVVDWFSKLSPKVIEVGVFITALAAAFALVVGPILLVIGFIPSILAGFAALKTVFLAVGTAIGAISWPLVLIVAAIIAAAALIYVYWKPIKAFFIALWDEIKVAGIAIWEALKSAWSSAISWIKNAWSTVTVFFTALWKVIKSGAIVIWDSVVSAWESTVVWVKGIWDTVAEFFVGLWEGIVSVAISVWDTVSAAWETSIEYLKTLFEPMINFFTETWESIAESASAVWETISETLSVVWDNIKIIAESAWEIIKNVILGPILLLIDLLTGNFEGFQEHLSQIWENISIAAGTIWESIKTIVTTIVDAAIAFISLAWESSMAFISGLWEALKETASNIWTALSSAVSSIVSSLVSTVSSLWENLRAAITKTVEAIKTAVNSAWKWIQTTSSTVFNAVKSTITSIWNGIKTFFTVTLGEIWTTVKQKFEDMKNSISEKMNEAWDKIVEIWDGVMAFFRDIDLLQIGKDIIDGLIKGIKSKVDAVGKAVTDVTSAITGKIKGILGIKSPSRVLAQIGRWTGEGLAQGIAGEEANVARAAQGLADASIVAAPTMSYATPNANYGSLSAALSGEVNVNQRDSMLIGAIASLEDKLTHLRVDLDGQRVGQMVTPHVNGANATDDLTRYF